MTLPDSPELVEKRASFQRKVCAEIEKRGLSNDELAELLGLFPIGADVLMSDSSWSLDVAAHVAEMIGLRVHVTVEPT